MKNHIKLSTLLESIVLILSMEFSVFKQNETVSMVHLIAILFLQFFLIKLFNYVAPHSQIFSENIFRNSKILGLLMISINLSHNIVIFVPSINIILHSQMHSITSMILLVSRKHGSLLIRNSIC